MRIALLFTNFDLVNITGQPAVIYSLAKRLKEKKEEMSIISNSESKINLPEGSLNIFLIKGKGDFKSYVLRIHKIIQRLKTFRPDIIHIHGYLISAFFWIINFLFLRKRLFCSVCETIKIIKNVFLKQWVIFCLKRVEKIFVTAEYIKNELIKYKIPKEKILITRIGLTEKFLDIKDTKQEETDVLYFGDSLKERGFDIVYGIAKRLPEIRFKVLLRWKGENCANELKEIKTLSNVEIFSYPYNEPLEITILKSKIVLLPYRWIGVRPPLSLIESMALGKCVITSDMPSTEEIVKDGINGFIIPLKELEEWIRKIILLKNEIKLRKKIEDAAKSTIKQLYAKMEYDKILSYYYGK